MFFVKYIENISAKYPFIWGSLQSEIFENTFIKYFENICVKYFEDICDKYVENIFVKYVENISAKSPFIWDLRPVCSLKYGSFEVSSLRWAGWTEQIFLKFLIFQRAFKLGDLIQCWTFQEHSQLCSVPIYCFFISCPYMDFFTLGLEWRPKRICSTDTLSLEKIYLFLNRLNLPFIKMKIRRKEDVHQVALHSTAEAREKASEPGGKAPN